jgi:hypothetical protein
VSEDKPAEKPAATGGDVTVSEDDVKLVMAQTDCSEEKAREALKAENGDLINASESARRAARRGRRGGPGRKWRSVPIVRGLGRHGQRWKRGKGNSEGTGSPE